MLTDHTREELVAKSTWGNCYMWSGILPNAHDRIVAEKKRGGGTINEAPTCAGGGFDITSVRLLESDILVVDAIPDPDKGYIQLRFWDRRDIQLVSQFYRSGDRISFSGDLCDLWDHIN